MTYTELEAFQRTRLIKLSAWEVELIMRLDDATLEGWASKTKTTAKTPEEGNKVEMSDSKGVRNFMSFLTTKINAQDNVKKLAKKRR